MKRNTLILLYIILIFANLESFYSLKLNSRESNLLKVPSYTETENRKKGILDIFGGILKLSAHTLSKISNKVNFAEKFECFKGNYQMIFI